MIQYSLLNPSRPIKGKIISPDSMNCHARSEMVGRCRSHGMVRQPAQIADDYVY